MKVIKNCFLRTLSVLFILCFLTVPAAFSAPVDLLPFENLTEDIGRGFGDNWNRYAWSMEEFNGDVYVGTWSVQFDWPGLIESLMSGDFDLGSGNPLEGIGILESRGGEIWKHEGGQNWTKVYKAGESDAGFRKMLEYNGNLYAGTANSEEGTNLYSSSGGATWTPLAGGPLDNADNNSIRTMMVCDGKLFVGTENNATGGELWAYNDNGSNWEQKGAGQFGGDPAVGQVATFNDKLYVGTWNFTDNFKLFMSVDGGDNFTDVTPNFAGSSDLMNLGVMKLVEFQGQFYLGTVNYLNGFTLLRASDPSNPSGWEVISTNGLGDPSNAYTWSMEVFDNTLYMGTFNSGLFGGIYDPLPIPLDGRAQLLYSGDGLNWETLIDDGFGSEFTYGFRTMTVSDNQLYVGTASNFFLYDPAVLEDYLTYLFANFDSMDSRSLSLLLARISDLYNCGCCNRNWIGCQVYASQSVPEPFTMLLLGFGLTGLAVFRRKFKKS